MSQEEERLQKVLARAGYGFRRGCEDLIRQGRVFVNGRVAELGQRADPERDQITVDGRSVRAPRSLKYIALYKPQGVLSAERDDSGRFRTVRDLVSLPDRLYPVGRLDLRSEGLTHPRYEHPKEYQVDVEGHPADKTLERWRQGVYLDDGRTAPAEISVISRKKDYTQLRVVLREGRKRQIRRVATKLGHPVRRLVRVRIGPIHLGDLTPGEWRPLDDREIKQLQRLKHRKNKTPTRTR
jgi:23S rRNA pseudouridine2605 synthase